MGYLIEMVDGGLKNVWSDDDSWGGCETCDYGSHYINEFTLELKGFDFRVTIDNMYNYGYSEDKLMKLLLPNIEEISKMTQEEFMDYVKKNVSEEADVEWSDADQPIKFEKIQRIY